MGNFLHSEQQYLMGNASTPESPSFLEDTISQTTIVFNVIVLACSALGIITSAMLIYGLYSDNKFLLVPWILTVLTTSMVDLAHSFYLFSIQTVTFDPTTAILFTVDFFLLSLNIIDDEAIVLNEAHSGGIKRICVLALPKEVAIQCYSLLCVVSQYQEYKAGRGTADFDYMNRRIPCVKYTPQPTGTSCLSTRRAVTYHETKASPTGSPPRPAQSGRKHVQWGGDLPPPTPAVIQMESPKDSVSSDLNGKSGGSPSEEGGSSVEWHTNNGKPGVDTLPLINPPPYEEVISRPM